MDKNNVVSAEIVRQITRMVVEELQKQQRLERSTPLGSQPPCPSGPDGHGRPVWSGQRADGQKMLGQPGQYAPEETVTIRGPKGELSRARAGAPARSDAGRDLHRRRLHAGVKPPVRESGQA